MWITVNRWFLHSAAAIGHSEGVAALAGGRMLELYEQDKEHSNTSFITPQPPTHPSTKCWIVSSLALVNSKPPDMKELKPQLKALKVLSS